MDLIQNFNLENSALNSNKSANIIVYQKNLKEIEEKEILTNNKFKYEEDYRYDNLLNDNSINFPKQFLDIDSKQYDSHREDTQNNNTHLNSHHKEPSNFKESSNTKNSKYLENNSFKNLNKNPNLNQNLPPICLKNLGLPKLFLKKKIILFKTALFKYLIFYFANFLGQLLYRILYLK